MIARLIEWLKRYARKALNGPYWGGITMWRYIKEAGARAASFLRRT